MQRIKKIKILEDIPKEKKINKSLDEDDIKLLDNYLEIIFKEYEEISI